EGLVRNSGERTEVGVDRGIAHERVDLPPLRERAIDEPGNLLLARDVAGYDDRLPARLSDAARHLLAGVRLAARDHALASQRAHDFGGGAATASARTGDDGHLPAKVEGVLHGSAASLSYTLACCQAGDARLGSTQS